ncbi:MAG: hypothetical protein ACR2MP_14710 [Streptosporangiaceae bacterium]
MLDDELDPLHHGAGEHGAEIAHGDRRDRHEPGRGGARGHGAGHDRQVLRCARGAAPVSPGGRRPGQEQARQDPGRDVVGGHHGERRHQCARRRHEIGWPAGPADEEEDGQDRQGQSQRLVGVLAVPVQKVGIGRVDQDGHAGRPGRLQELVGEQEQRPDQGQPRPADQDQSARVDGQAGQAHERIRRDGQPRVVAGGPDQRVVAEQPA